jgi:serine protease inhibitor
MADLRGIQDGTLVIHPIIHKAHLLAQEHSIYQMAIASIALLSVETQHSILMVLLLVIRIEAPI